MNDSSNPLAGMQQPEEIPQGITAPIPSVHDLAGSVASGANSNAASNPAPAAPGAWARNLMGGVMDALSGFGAGGQVPPGGALGGIGAAARQMQKVQAQRKQQQFENQQNAQKLTNETDRNKALNAYTSSLTVADQHTSARLDQEESERRSTAGRAIIATMKKNHDPINENVPVTEISPQDLKTGGKYDAHTTIGYQVGTAEVEQNGKIVSVPTMSFVKRQAGIISQVDPAVGQFLKDNGQPLPSLTNVDSDLLDSKYTEAMANFTTTSAINKAIQGSELEKLTAGASIQDKKDRALVNPALGYSQPGDEIGGLTRLAGQVDPKTKQSTNQAQAAQRILGHWDPKELETYRHDKADELAKQNELNQKQIEDANKKKLAGTDFTGDPDATNPAAFRNSLEPNAQGVVDMIGQGRAPLNNPAYLLARKPEVMGAVEKAYPGFDASKVTSYQKTYQDYTSGNMSKQLTSGATALEHLSELRQLNTVMSRVPTTAAKQSYDNKLETVAAELARFYGNTTEQGIKSFRDTLAATFNRDAAITTQAKSMGDRLDNLEQTWVNAAPSKAYQAPMPGISNAAKQARASLDPEYAQRLASESKGAPATPPPAGAPGTHQVMNKADNKMHWTDGAGSKDLGVVAP